MCPPLPPSDHHNLCPTAATSNDHQRVLATRWWFPRLPCALHRHQRVTTTCWWLISSLIDVLISWVIFFKNSNLGGLTSFANFSSMSAQVAHLRCLTCIFR